MKSHLSGSVFHARACVSPFRPTCTSMPVHCAMSRVFSYGGGEGGEEDIPHLSQVACLR